jgi:very-short-patch-repair endonuclease
MTFEQSHEIWIQEHLKKRRGERRGRLERGHGHAEKLFAQNVWWRLKGNFEQLHPEYEVVDWRGRPYFADFCYRPGNRLRLIIEIKGFATHVRDLDREGFSRECNRETFLTGNGYTVISFSYDDVKERPEVCLMLLRMVLSRFESGRGAADRVALAEQETLRLALTLARDIRPVDVIRHLKMNRRTAIRILQRLCQKGRLTAVRRGSRMMRYRLAEGDNILDAF